ncbi:lipoprotein 17-related variable surface protein [Malacoplasma penetrans]|uniref:lipoprotein 17-related variable surface protein n=1 Tax=Malacoplasma penetrans TaxID=28227 RepID=UPI0013E98BEF|nr:lipoprotein 17-related variable surface protein [Malacoplasma penetrans]
MNKLSKKIILSSICSTLSVGMGLSIGLSLNNLNSSSIINTKSINQATSSSDLIPSESNDQNANLSTTSGPVTFTGNKISALDWYGNQLWTLDLAQNIADASGAKPGTSYNDGSWQRAWFNWDYNRATNLIWVLGFWSKTTKTQPILGIDASTGEIKHSHDISYSSAGLNITAVNSSYRFITALSSGKVMVYGGAAFHYEAKGLLYDPTSNSVSLVSGDSADQSILPKGDTSYGSNYRWYFFNLMPIADNKNIVEVVNYANSSGLTGDQGNGLANYNTYFLLVDDSLNMISKTDSTWSKPVKVADGMQNYRNTAITPQRDYYTMLDGKVVTVVYNTAIVIDASGSSVQVGTYPMSESKWIKSWAFDSNQNLYFKFKDEKKIYKVSGNVWNSLNGGTATTVTPTTYLDLDGFADTKPCADNLMIYNVYGYTGQLLLINSHYSPYINLTTNPEITSDNNSSNYGLAFAITQNSNQQDKGDYKGTLNGPNSFQKAADFDINASVLNSKLPSEITRSDLELQNGGILKEADVAKWPPFTISEINDETGTFKVTVNLYQIPWFVDTLPSDATPKTITKSFTAQKISTKVSWKTLSETSDYDFLNMKPSTITAQDVTNLDPFQVSFQSQTITNSQGVQLYPKKTYSVGTTNDATGEVEVKISYEYVPMGVTYTNSSSVKTYTSSTKYTVFKTTDTATFKFVGQTASSSSTRIDVTTTPQLKNLLSANTLPSSFDSLNSSNNSTNSSFLQFVNTSDSKGYPISKMNFRVSSNDTNGELTITATMPSQYSPNGSAQTFSVTYTNLNKSSNYGFNFKTTTNTIDGNAFSTMLPSVVTEGNIINNLIEYTGFNSNDFTITKTANDAEGTLVVSIELNRNYASQVGNGNSGFTNYTASYTFTGFMNSDQFNQRFNVSFVSDTSEKLLALKQMQVSQIYSDLTDANKTLTLSDGSTYKDVKELMEKLLVESLGTSIPQNWSSQSSISATMYVDNSQGTASFYLNIPKDLIDGSETDLNLVVNYTGFVKGNVDSTDDNLSFVANNMLKSFLVSNGSFTAEQFDNLTPLEFSNWLKENNNENALKLISYKSGQYQTILNGTTGYTVSVITNETQRTVSIYINFDGITNSQSLSEYSIQYSI